MFKAANPYDEIVGKATDENLTSENWQLNLDVCDKVSGDGENGARNCVAAILKRLVHRNANVQLYALTLSDALAKNCGITAHRELASRSFCQTLQRIVTDRNTHSTVKQKSLAVLKSWTQEWGQDESLGLVRETMEALSSQGISLQEETAEPKPEPSSEQLRAEDEELRRVLELSLQDQGGRGTAPTTQSASAGIGEASSSAYPTSSAAGSSSSVNHAAVNKRLPEPVQQTSTSALSQPIASPDVFSSGAAPTSRQGPAASRVRALYDFTPTEEGELAFQKGDLIRVLDSVYEHWWRGELRGEAGIFPVNYVELLPDPTPADIQREAELEARIFAQANDIDRLLSKLRGLDPARDNLAEDEELQELYQSSLTMRPKIVKLIDRYNLKVTELRTMNDKFVRARSTFDAMMEQSMSKYHPNGGFAGSNVDIAAQAAPYYAQPSAQYDGNGPYQTTSAAGQPPASQAQPSVNVNGVSNPGPAIGVQVQPSPHQQQQQQQQQEYAQSWANWYAQQQGYPSHPPQSSPGVNAPAMAAPQPGPQSNHSNAPNYQQWSYPQQQQLPNQQQQHQGQQSH